MVGPYGSRRATPTRCSATRRALRREPNDALVSVTRVGPQPLGLALADRGRMLLVADSNSYSRGSRSAVSVVNTAPAGKATLVGSIRVGRLSDAISVPASGELALVTDSDGRALEVLGIQGLP